MSEAFTRESIREHHRVKIKKIINQGGGVEEIDNYLMNRISTVISYERRKNERRQLRKVTKNRSVFSNDEALTEILYLAILDVMKK